MVTTALLMGLAGSLHCVGMCSPLALAVSNLNPAAVLSRFIYNAGRILTYGVMGAVLGSAQWLLPLSQYQNILSAFLGITLLCIAIFGISNIKVPLVTPLLQWLSNYLKNVFGVILKRKNSASIFLLGALNGLLPCGLTFAALMYCFTLQGPADSFLFMILFGAGTLPVMLGLTSFFQYLVKRFSLNFKKVSGAVLVLSGVLLIARVFLFNHGHISPEEEQVVDIILCR